MLDVLLGITLGVLCSKGRGIQQVLMVVLTGLVLFSYHTYDLPTTNLIESNVKEMTTNE